MGRPSRFSPEVRGHLAQLAEQTRRDMARQGEAELADASQPQAVGGIRLFTADHRLDCPG